MNIKVLKLVTGEDIITELEEEETCYKLKNSIHIAVFSKTGTDTNIKFIPFPFFSDDKLIVIEKSKVMYVCEPLDEFKNQYNQVFGSGIITPPKGLVLN